MTKEKKVEEDVHVEELKIKCEKLKEIVKAKIKKNPVLSTAVGLGVGLLVGAVAGIIIGKVK